jgi:AAA ATPase-like protein
MIPERCSLSRRCIDAGIAVLPASSRPKQQRQGLLFHYAARRHRHNAFGLPLPLPDLVVGRETDLAYLYDWLEQACEGKRQMVFIAGEAGIGKTTVVDAFVAASPPQRG